MSDPQQPDASRSSTSGVRRRRRPALSCEPCRRRKVRCDRNMPCSNCIRARDPSIVCTFQLFEPRSKRSGVVGQNSPGPRPASAASAVGTIGSPPGPGGPSAAARSCEPSTGLDIGCRLDERFPIRAAAGFGVPIGLSLSSFEGEALDSNTAATTTTMTAGTTTASTTTATATTTATGVDSSNTPSSFTSSTYSSLMERVRQLEVQLGEKLSLQDTTQNHQARGPTVPPGKLRVVDNPSDPAPVRGTVSKTRLFGTSHWMNGTELFPIKIRMIQKIYSDGSNEAYRMIQQCKALGKVIKAQRSSFFTSISLGQRMPSREVADKLVDAYLRTFETVVRILHVPSFRKEYELFWASPRHQAAGSHGFVILLQLVMAIGASLHDDTFSLRPDAVQWIQEARFWLSLPFEKQRLTIQGIQIMCLLHFARETCGVSPDLVWISAGSLVRYAMMMGLHRDPSKLGQMSVFRAEIRRRLWAVMLEIALHSCIDAGGPPLIRMQDFDTKLPANLNDDQLTDAKDLPPAGTVDEQAFTETTVQIALSRTFPTRLSIACYLNNISSFHSFEETLRLSKDLTKAVRRMSVELHSFCSRAAVAGGGGDGDVPGVGGRPSAFQIAVLELMTHRFFIALHLPMLMQHPRDPSYYFSRKLCVDTALRLYHSAVLVQETTTSPERSASTVGGDQEDAPATTTAAGELSYFRRLCINGAGPFRSIPMQAIMMIKLELELRAEEDDPFSFIPLASPAPAPSLPYSSGVRQGELLAALRSAVSWSLRRVRSGETNPRGYVGISSLWAQASYIAKRRAAMGDGVIGMGTGVDEREDDMLLSDSGKEADLEMEEVIIKAAVESAEMALREMREVAKALGIDVGQVQSQSRLGREKGRERGGPHAQEQGEGKGTGLDGGEKLSTADGGMDDEEIDMENTTPAAVGMGGISADFGAWNDFDFMMQDDTFPPNFWQDLMPM